MQKTNKIDILLIYPKLGSFDTIIRDIPLSLIYAAADSVKNGYSVRIFDCRLHPNDFMERIRELLKEGCFLVGLSVMTGYPIKTALAISKFIKEGYDVPIVWGGPHPTVLPEQTLESPYIDYVIRDWGSEALHRLISYIRDNACLIEEITGLGYKRDGKIFLNQTTNKFEMIDYHDIPYHLVDIDLKNYNRLQGKDFFFPIYTAMGCPSQCTFCMSPSVYKKIEGKKWIPYSDDSVIEHIEYLTGKYEFQRLQVYDDNSFVDLNRMREFFKKYISRGLHEKLKIDFRGVRIDALDRMDDDFLQLMVRANVEMLELGAESGSDKSLLRMKKGITVEQILRASRKLVKYPSLKPHYNILCGIPGETYEDLKQTKVLMQTLVKDNPSCLLGAAADWKPLPGSLMTEIAVRDYNLVLPARLEEWIRIDTTDAEKIVHPWYTRRINNYIKLLQLSGLLLDGKVKMIKAMIPPGKALMMRFLLSCVKMYLPLLKARLRFNFSALLIEYSIKNFLMKLISSK